MKLDLILVPTDYSADAKKALETAVGLARVSKGRIVLLHAYALELPFKGTPGGGSVLLPDGFYVEYRDQATLRVEREARQVAARERLEVEGIAIDRPAWIAIVEEAKRLGADLIVMGTRGLTGLKHVALGSTAERVVRKASCPVLTVKA